MRSRFSDTRSGALLALLLLLWELAAASSASGQQVRADGITVTASGTIDTGTQAGDFGHGLWALNGGVIQSFTPLTITTAGVNTAGARSTSAGQVTVSTGSSIHMTGTNGDGIVSSGAGSLVIATRTTILTDLSGYGLIAGTGGGRIIFNQGSVAASTSTGAAAFSGVLELADSSITTGPGIALRLDAGTATLNDTSISTSGASAYGVYLTNGSGFTMTGGTISATAARGIIGVAGTNSVVLDRATIHAVASAAIEANGATAVLNAQLTETAITAPIAFRALAGTLNVTAESSMLRGSAVIGSGGTANLALSDSSTWMLTANSTLTSLTNGTSLIDFGAPVGDPTELVSFKTLTVSNYLGVGGRLGLNTYLDGDGAPSDRLVIDGAASGVSGLVIKNAGGAGSLTAGDGILVVSAVGGGTTAPDAFSLAAPAVAGPYEYSLYHGSVDGTGQQNWYLRSDYVPASVPPVVPPAPPPPPTSIPHYRQEVSLIAAIPPMAALYGRSMLETLHGRQGEPGTPPGIVDTQGTNTRWGRVLGISGRHSGDPLGIYEGSEPSYEFTLTGLQTGQDLYRYQAPDGGRDVVGIYFGIGSAWGVVEHDLPDRHFHAGTTSLNAYSLGGYWTRQSAGGAYLDGLLQATFYNFTTASRRIPDAHTNGLGLAASLEAGYPLNLGKGWILEPQVQGILQIFDIDGFNDGAATVDYSDATSLIGRAGLRLARSFIMDSPVGEQRSATIWGTVNLTHELLGKPTTTFSSQDGAVPFTADLSDTRAQFSLGGDVTLNPTASFFGEVGYETTIDGASNAISARIGLKGRW